ncbi:MAG: hypothetical protein U0521_22755 [Anaerolineae bacterium]
MPVDVSWFLDKRVLMCRFQGNVTIEELRDLAQTGIDSLETCSYPVMHSLYDAAALTSLPINLQSIAHAASRPYAHPKMGWIAIYNAHVPILAFAADMILRLFRVRYRIVNTQADALDFLNAIDPDLPPLQPLAKNGEPTTG